ncbi:MAG: CinA family protein, partial [Dehalococcoidia bacterium]
ASNRAQADGMIEPVEAEVRGLLGEHLFAADSQTMPEVVGGLLRERGLSVSIYEGLTGGLAIQQVQEAAPDQFRQGVIGRQESVMRRLIEEHDRQISYEELQSDEAALADRLAVAVKGRSGADLGLAVVGIPEEGQATENLNAGRTYISVAAEWGTARRSYNFAGPGLPDRSRTAMYALDLLRTSILQSGSA